MKFANFIQKIFVSNLSAKNNFSYITVEQSIVRNNEDRRQKVKK